MDHSRKFPAFSTSKNLYQILSIPRCVSPACTDDAAVEGTDDRFSTALEGSDAFLQGEGDGDGFSPATNCGFNQWFWNGGFNQLKSTEKWSI